jgi:myo-inositol catabolism protein IolC
MNADRVYMLAADHRWQWEEWCDARSMPRARIGDVKRLAYDGFLLARDRSPVVRESGALLIDEEYASAVITDALKARVNVGTPAEKAGAFPLAWSEPFSRALTGAFVKVLVRYRPDDDAEIREGQ